MSGDLEHGTANVRGAYLSRFSGKGEYLGIEAKTKRDRIGKERTVSTAKPDRVPVTRSEHDKAEGVFRVEFTRGRRLITRFERTTDLGDAPMPAPARLWNQSTARISPDEALIREFEV